MAIPGGLLPLLPKDIPTNSDRLQAGESGTEQRDRPVEATRGLWFRLLA